MRVFGARLEFEQVHNVDKANLQFRELLAEEVGRRERFLGRNIPSAGHHHVRFLAVIRAGLLPDADPLSAVDNRLVHVQVLQVILLVRHNHVDVPTAAQTVIRHG